MNETRVRFAPSPTGSTHIGTARTALFNWLYARKTGGAFVLRIEDTDRERNTQAALEELLDGLKWLGLDWDEGPGKAGPHGPYFQSERGDVYRDYLRHLTNAGRTYEKDGATYFRLEGERYTEYDAYLGGEVEKVRTKPVTIHDLIRGKVVRREERDFVLQRSSGDPSFHFVNVVDDISMEISHVIRGEDHLSNTSKHVELFNALGVAPPQFAHLPMILKDPKSGKGKMSKRDKGALISEYKERNFIPEAVRNFIALLGWSPKDGQEKLAIDELIDRFDLADVQKGGARFDERKMSHLNFEYLKAMPSSQYAEFARASLERAGLVSEETPSSYIQEVLALVQEKIDSLENLPGFAAYFFTEDYAVDEKIARKIRGKPENQDRAKEALSRLDKLDLWNQDHIEKAFLDLADENEIKPFAWYPVVRFAVSGLASGPDFLPMLETLGQQRTTDRIRRFVGS